MKLSKVLIGSLFAAAMVGLFAGCAEEEDENGMLKVSGSNCSIEYTNESTGYSRGFKSLKTLRLDAICKISNETTALKNNGDGVMGYIFALEQANDKTYSFGLAGVRNDNGTITGYVSYYTGVSGAYLSSGSDFCDANGIVAGKTGSSATCTDYTSPVFSTIKSNAGKTFDIWIDVIANDGSSVGREGEAGSYTVSFYTADPGRTTAGIGHDTTYANSATVSPVLTKTIPASATGRTSATQLDIGFYANVYAGCTLKGTWALSDIEGEGQPVEYVD